MSRLRTSATRLRIDLEASVRNLGHEVGLGVVEALQQRPTDEEPGYHAQELARGAMRGIDLGLEDDHLRQSLALTVEIAVDAALSAALARSPELQQVSEDTARAFARGALGEVRAQLPRPMVLLAVAGGIGLLAALLLRRG